MDWSSILGLYILLSLGVYAILIAVLDPFYGPLENPFTLQCTLYEEIKDELNILGIIILEFIVTALTFGMSVILLITQAIIYTFKLVGKLFYFIFKKR